MTALVAGYQEQLPSGFIKQTFQCIYCKFGSTLIDIECIIWLAFEHLVLLKQFWKFSIFILTTKFVYDGDEPPLGKWDWHTATQIGLIGLLSKRVCFRDCRECLKFGVIFSFVTHFLLAYIGMLPYIALGRWVTSPLGTEYRTPDYFYAVFLRWRIHPLNAGGIWIMLGILCSYQGYGACQSRCLLI